MRHCTGIVCLSLLMTLSGFVGAATDNVALSQAHELYLDQYDNLQTGVFADSGLLFVKVLVERERKESQRQVQHKALQQTRTVLKEYLVKNKGYSEGFISLPRIASRVLVSRRAGEQ